MSEGDRDEPSQGQAPKQGNLPAIRHQNQSDFDVISAVERNLANATPQDATKWLKTLEGLKKVQREDRLLRYTAIEAGVKIVMPVVFFITGVGFLVSGFIGLHIIGIGLLAAAIATFTPRYVASIIQAIVRFTGGDNNGGT